MNLIISVIKFLLIVLATVAVLQIGAVYLLRFMQHDPAPADLISIMPSSKQRIIAGCMIAARQGSGDLMLISNSLQALNKYAARLEVPDSVTLLPGGKSRSSFEDIHVTVQTALDRNLKSVILVTSDYHLPRALFLLYAYNLFTGSDLRVEYGGAQEPTRRTTRLRQMYSEAVKFWGSAVEMSGYLLTRKLPLDSERLMAVRNTLKRTFLLVE